ncbi:MAG TPA: GNAT family N-acetyltransferase [Steroidobacteraceae bacterium]|nr:GNAT family N-acetyltransferase [Steroidobacteraceae bacterium]
MDIIAAAHVDRHALTTTLANAFRVDPMVNWIVRKDEHKRRGFECFFATGLRLYLPLGTVTMTADKLGAAVWVPRNKWKIGAIRQLALIPAMITIAGLPRIGVCADGLAAIEREHPMVPHLYLHHLGVDPSMQGKGYGGRLLHQGLCRADAERLPTYLETGNEETLSFYRHFGFEVTKTITISAGAPPLWLMWRDAK